jgi:hypothetical protein
MEAKVMQVGKQELNVKGSYIQVDSVRLDGKVLVITGRFLKTASVLEEIYVDVEDPELLIRGLGESGLEPDIFTFSERFPGPEPKFDYYTEWEANSILPVTSYDHWYNNQIVKVTRWSIRTAEKKGVVVRFTPFSDDLVKRIKNIYDETPVRQGKPFWHYQKEFDVLKEDLSRDLERSDFIGAYYNDELIGFIKMLYADKVADPVLCISMIRHYDKFPNNALIAQAVKIAEEKKIPYIHYGSWRRETHAKFLAANGFEKVLCPRYYCPLTAKGKMALKLRLHKGLLNALPESVREGLKYARASLFKLKLRKSETKLL